VEFKLRWVNFRRASDPRRAFLLAFRVTEISDDWYRSTMEVIVIGFGTPRGTGENLGCIWEHLRAPGTSLEALTTSLGAPGSAGNKSWSTSNQSRAVWEKQHLLSECCWCAWKS